MASSAKLYGNAPLAFLNKEIDWTADTIKVALCTSDYTPDQDTHVYFDDITHEIDSAGYTAGGATLTGCTSTYTAATKVTKYDADDAVWTPCTVTFRYAILYDSTPGSAATNPLIGDVDFGADSSTIAGTLTILFSANGIFTLTVD
jgi:hypothetical protein